MFYKFDLPIPVSVNAAYSIGKGRAGRHMRRSDEYDIWTKQANRFWQEICRSGMPEMLQGRIRADLVYVFNNPLSDCDNRIKATKDFMQRKFFKNDNQVDELHVYKRLWKRDEKVIICVSEIPDNRYDDPELIFNPT